MQSDFHHGITYVVARLAGFAHRQAEVIAYCAQYVDDATNSGTIRFINDAMYTRISSAHKTLDYRNFSKLANHHVWIPFHFLPGNGGKAAGDNPNGSFIQKLVCQPDSYVAREMVEDCIVERHMPYGLHRLGITMHVFADTWAHQGFAGVSHQINDITIIDDDDQPHASFEKCLIEFFGDIRDWATHRFVCDLMPLGHGPALSNPDLPYLKWRYRDSSGNIIRRDNTAIFSQAAHEMCKAMQRFQAGDPKANVPGLSTTHRAQIEKWMAQLINKESSKRHKQWLKLIAKGEFGFPPIKLTYKDKGRDSWKHQALGTSRKRDLRNQEFPYSPGFLACDWKLFHDALLAHHFSMIHYILPKYGICAA